MAKIALIFGLEQAVAGQICRALAVEKHQVEWYPHDIHIPDLRGADIVFAGGEPACYMALLRRIRQAQPSLPFIVVTRIAETSEWLDALEAGATDYCSAPIERRQIHWLLESTLLRRRYPDLSRNTVSLKASD